MSEKFILEGTRIDESNPDEIFKAEMNMIIQASRDFDSGEISQMYQMMRDVEAGEMSREEALEKARALKGAKSDYH